MRLTWAVASDPGLRRPGNEDSYCGRPDIGLFLVADGMGGHAAGEVASRMAVEVVEGFVHDTAGCDRNRTWPFPFDPSISVDGNRLTAAFRLANRRIAEAMADSAALRGMATTASAVLVAGGTAVVAHVGDSRVYLLRAGRLEQVTHDHSWVEEQVRAGTLTASDARRHPWRNVVTRALAGGDDPQVDVRELALQAGDRLLLCSDGLSSVLQNDGIAEILGRPGDLPQICRALIEAANREGGPDNITSLVLHVDAA